MSIEKQIIAIVRRELAAYRQPAADVWLTTEEVMLKYGIKSKATLNNYHRRGLPYTKGKPNRYTQQDLDRFFKKSRVVR